MPRERTDAGTFAETVTLEDVVDVFDRVRGPIITSSDVADALDCTTEAARQKLQRLYDRGEVDKRKTGRTVVYWRTGVEWITDDEQAVEDKSTAELMGDVTQIVDQADLVAESARESDERQSQDTADRTDSSPTPAGETPDTGAQDGEKILRDLDLPGSGAKLDARLDAVLGLYEYLRENAGDPVARADLLDHVDADAVGYASKESFWNNFVKANSSQGRDTNALVALPGVEEWGDGEYRYTEEF